MVKNAYMIILEFLIFYVMRLAKRLMDSCCTLNKYKTKTKSIQAYLDINCGPDYLMHVKYAEIL